MNRTIMDSSESSKPPHNHVNTITAREASNYSNTGNQNNHQKSVPRTQHHLLSDRQTFVIGVNRCAAESSYTCSVSLEMHASPRGHLC